jgi:hypothetical protein
LKSHAEIAALNSSHALVCNAQSVAQIASRESNTDLAVLRRHRSSKHRLALVLPMLGRLRLTDHQASWWLALRASLLRRAVSSWVRPLLQHSTSSVSVGRMPLRPALLPFAARSCAFARPVRLYKGGWVSTLLPVRPNRSLNRTHCGVPPFGLENPSPNAATPQRSG